MRARPPSPWPFLLGALRRAARPGFGRAELDAAGLDPAALIAAGLIERAAPGAWCPPSCERGCLPNFDFETRRADGLVGVACPDEPACWPGFEWHLATEIERFSTSATRVLGVLRPVNGLEPIAPIAGIAAVPVGMLARRGMRVPVVWTLSDAGAFLPTCRALRAELGGDGLAVLVSRPRGTLPVLHEGGIASIDIPLDETGDLRLWRALDLLVPDYRKTRTTEPLATFDDVRITFAEEPGARHVVRINGRDYDGFQKSDLRFLRFLVLAAARRADPDVDRGGWLRKSKLEGTGKDRALEDLREELRKHDHPALAAEERIALLKSSPTKDGTIRLGVPPENIIFDESLADIALIGERQTEPRDGKSRRTPGEKERAENFALRDQIAQALLDAARRLGVPGPRTAAGRGETAPR